MSSNNIRKAQTNDILFSLLKEIDKYNDSQVRQKIAAESYEAKMKSSIISDNTNMQSITISPQKRGDHSPTAAPGYSDQSASRSNRESKDFDMKRCINS